jgi:hypothetical protein
MSASRWFYYKNYQQFIPAVQVLTPLRNDDSVSSIAAPNLQRMYDISKRHSLNGYDWVRINIQRCLKKTCNKRTRNWRDLRNWSTSFLNSQNTIPREHRKGIQNFGWEIKWGDYSVLHKNNVTFILDTLLRQQNIKTVQAVQHRFIRISQRCPYSSPMTHCGPQSWNFFQKITESYLFLFSFPFKWHPYLSFHSLNILHGFPYDLQNKQRVEASQMHYFSNSLKRSPRCRKGSNTTGYRRTYLILQLPCFPYAKPLTCHEGEKNMLIKSPCRARKRFIF